MIYDQGKYKHEDVLKILTANNRRVHYEYAVEDNSGHHLGWLTKCDGKISYDSTSSVMRSFTGRAMKSELLDINLIDEKIVPWMCIENQGDTLKYPLGKFIISPSYFKSGSDLYASIVGYDMGKIALDDKTVSRFVKKKNNFYTNEIQEILSELYDMSMVDTSELKRMNDFEWNPGVSKLQIINDILKSLNYYPLHFNEYGIPIGRMYVFPESQNIDMYYKTDKKSVLLPDVNISSNRFDIPNKFVRYVENVDGNYLIGIYTNDDPKDKFSTVGRGRTITDIKSINDIASQEELDNYVKRCAVAARTITETINFKTLNMPGHGFKNCLFLEVDELGIREKVIELGWEMDLQPGGEMLHKCVKVVRMI